MHSAKSQDGFLLSADGTMSNVIVDDFLINLFEMLIDLCFFDSSDKILEIVALNGRIFRVTPLDFLNVTIDFAGGVEPIANVV